MISCFAHIEDLVAGLPPGRIAIAAAHDDHVLQSVGQICAKGYATAFLIGDKEKIIRIADEQQVDITHMTMIKELDERKSADIAVQMAGNGEADVVMKGMLQTADFLKAVLEKERGLRTNALLSHVGFYEFAEYPKLLCITDGGINIAPDLHQKVEIIKNAVEITRSLGIEMPKVAVLAAIETVNPAMPATLDAAALAKMAQRGQIKNCLIDGPLAMDNAISPDAAHHKQIISDVAGDADILLVPDIEAGNILVKALVFLFHARSCSVIAGARVPLVVTSRADGSDAKYNSILLALAMRNPVERKGDMNMAKDKQAIISVWVEDKAGVLWHVSQIFGEQDCNIESLTVGKTEKPGVSRMTIVVNGESQAIKTVMARLNRMTSLIKVKIINDDESVLVELGLIMVDAPDNKKTDIINLVNVFRARIVDVAINSMTIAVSGSPDKIQALVDLLHPFGILEIVRTGTIAIDRGKRGLL